MAAADRSRYSRECLTGCCKRNGTKLKYNKFSEPGDCSLPNSLRMVTSYACDTLLAKQVCGKTADVQEECVPLYVRVSRRPPRRRRIGHIFPTCPPARPVPIAPGQIHQVPFSSQFRFKEGIQTASNVTFSPFVTRDTLCSLLLSFSSHFSNIKFTPESRLNTCA